MATPCPGRLETGQGKVYLGDTFSLNMLPLVGRVLAARKVVVKFTRVDIDEVRDLLINDFISVIKHPAIASAVSKLLGMNVPTNRVSITLQPGDTLIVFQLADDSLVSSQELSEQDILRAFWRGDAFFAVVQMQ